MQGALIALALIGAAQASTPAVSADPELPRILLGDALPICFGVAHGQALDQIPGAPQLLVPTRDRAMLRGRYLNVPSWYRSTTAPHLFIGVGDQPNRCHIMVADTPDSPRLYRALIGYFTLMGMEHGRPDTPYAQEIFVKRAPDDNLLVFMRGVGTRDGAGPQLEIDVGHASDAELAALLPTGSR